MDFTESLRGYRIDAQIKNVPVAFVNGLRRILLSEIPTVVIRDVQILENNTKMIHEMLRHRIEMLPVNVQPEEATVVRDTKIELRYMTTADTKREKVVDVTTDDFVVAGPRKNVLLKDRDEDRPIYFMKLQPNESIHLRASLGVELKGACQVCVATFKNHIDENLAKLDKDSYMEQGGHPKVFDNYEIQRSFARDEQGRPYWFDLSVESIGVIPAKTLLKQAALIFKEKVVEWCKNPILRSDENWYSIETETQGHTIGALAQALIYEAALVDTVSYRIAHPLLPKMIVKFNGKVAPETVIERFKTDALALCDRVLEAII